MCGVPRRGIPSITKVKCSSSAETIKPSEALESRNGDAGTRTAVVPSAVVVEIPVESLRRGKLFTPPALDAFLRVVNIGSAWYAREGGDREGERGSVAGMENETGLRPGVDGQKRMKQ